MKKHGKRYNETMKQIDRNNAYEFKDGIKLLKQLQGPKFDETVDLAVNLGINTKQTDQNIRGTVVLPYGLGKQVKVVVFTKNEKEALSAGADYAGSEELVNKVMAGWLDFDTVIATPDLMGTVSKLGKILGPKKLMPNPKLGTVTFEIAKAVKDAKAGKIEIKNDKGGVVHTVIGKKSFPEDRLAENFDAVMEKFKSMKPVTTKGQFLKSAYLSTTMGPSIKLEISRYR
ncbi:MAG: 50S ribosomal protein L1 [Deltaproteobacteria bacterium]|nr:50S ribosomal protein L1 [Deltaproteobacteria bacterium]MCL5276523.1 50S ribosomal protein L1 [Deltaproteobacteria bacterium]